MTIDKSIGARIPINANTRNIFKCVYSCSFSKHKFCLNSTSGLSYMYDLVDGMWLNRKKGQNTNAMKLNKMSLEVFCPNGHVKISLYFADTIGVYSRMARWEVQPICYVTIENLIIYQTYINYDSFLATQINTVMFSISLHLYQEK